MQSTITEQCICGGTATWTGSKQACDNPVCMFYAKPTAGTTAIDQHRLPTHLDRCRHMLPLPTHLDQFRAWGELR